MDSGPIANLVYLYCRALDRLDGDLLRSLFHDDAQIDMGAIYKGGPDGFVPVAIGFMGTMLATRHCVSNILVTAQGVESYVDAWHLLPDDRELVVRGRYLQKVAERGGRLAFSHHSEVIDFGTERPVDPNWYAGEIGLPRGERGRGDASYAFVE